MPKCFLPRRRKTLWSIFKNDSIKNSFQKNSSFLSTFLWTPRMRIWRKCWIFLPKSQFFAKVTRVNKKFNFPQKIFFFKLLSWTCKMQFGQPFSPFFAKVLKKVVWKSKNDQEEYILYFKVVVFSQIVTLDTEIAFLTSLPKNLISIVG